MPRSGQWNSARSFDPGKRRPSFFALTSHNPTSEMLERRPIGQPDRPRTCYCSIGFQPVSSIHGTEARQARPFVPMVKNTRSPGLEVLKGQGRLSLSIYAFIDQSEVGQPSRLALSCSHVWCWIDDRGRGPFRANRWVHFPGVKTR